MESWMNSLPQTLKNSTINNIILPGSHDSCTYNLDLSIPTISSMEKFRKNIGRIYSSPISVWTITQKYDIYSQLMFGIRYFDIYVSFLNNTIYTTHTFVNNLLINILDRFNIFSLSHPSEIIILDITTDYENKSSFSLDASTLFCELIKKHPIYKLCYNGDNNTSLPTYNQLINLKTPIILLIDNDVHQNNSIKRLSYDFRFKKWTNAQTPDKNTIQSLINMININQQNKNIDKLFIWQETVTPDNNDVTKGLIFYLLPYIISLINVIVMVILFTLRNKLNKKHFVIFYSIALFMLLLSLLLRIVSNTDLNKFSSTVKNSIVSIFLQNPHMLKYVTVISGDFVDENFVKNVVNLNSLL